MYRDGVMETGLSTVTCQVSGAIGIAMLASVQDAAYNRRVEDQLVGAPEEITQAATESVAGAHRVAVEIGAGFLLVTAGILFRLMRTVS